MPLGGSGGEHGYGEPATACGGRDEEDPSRSSHPAPLPLLPGLAVIPMASEVCSHPPSNPRSRSWYWEPESLNGLFIPILEREEEETEACAAGGRGSNGELSGGRSHGDPVTGALQVVVPLQVCVQRVARRLLLLPHPQEVAAGHVRLLLQNHGLRFHNLSGKGPPMVDPDLSFLRSSYKHFSVTQCSTSLLLCKCWKVPYPKQLGWNSLHKGKTEQCFEWPKADEFDYVVCSPATQEWTLLPPIELPDHLPLFHAGKYFLGFDAAIPSRFVVFVPLNSSQTYGLSADMIYSSDTGGWTFTQRNDFSTYSISYLESTFLNNTMHFPTRYSVIITVDMERKDWRKIKMPRGVTNEHGDISIGKSQGRLFAWRIKNQGDCQLSI